MTGSVLFYLMSSSAGFSLGTVYLKRFADAGGFHDLGISFVIFAISNLLYAKLLAIGLGPGTVLSSMAQLVLMSVVGIAMFSEKLSPYSLTGLVFALMTIWMFALHTQMAN